MLGLAEGSNTLLHFQLFVAARRGDLGLFKRLALNIAKDEGTGVSEAVAKFRLTDGGGMLHVAAQAGTLNILKYLLETVKLDFYLEARDVNGDTPLCHATWKGHLDTTRYLLEKGANADATNDDNYTPLHNAAKTGNTKIITLLLSRGVRIDVPTRIDTCTALQLAAYEGHQDAFKMLLDHGADVRGCNMLHVVAQGGNLNFCKYLLETLKLDLDLDAKDANGHTPLYHAIEKGHLDTIRYLLLKGANADASTDGNYTPLHCAAKTGDTKILTLLLSRGVRINVPTLTGTALQIAAREGHRDAVKVLLDHGANPNVASTDGESAPLIEAVYAGSTECVELLLQAGADPNAVSFGNTPLIAAVKNGSADVITRLLEAGADPDYKMNLGMTALEVAAGYHKYESVAVLFPVTSPILTYPDWSIAGVLRDVDSDANNMQRKVHEKEKFHHAKSKGRDAFQEGKYRIAAAFFLEAWAISPEDPAVLSNMSACFARLGDGINALKYATECMDERPEWPKAYYRKGVALNILKRYDEAADAFNKGLELDPSNKELKDAYMKAMEDRLNSMKVEDVD